MGLKRRMREKLLGGCVVQNISYFTLRVCSVNDPKC